MGKGERGNLCSKHPTNPPPHPKNDMEERDILKKAIIHYTATHQKRKAVEEMGELIVELSREADGRSGDADIITEIADVKIMMAQLSLIYGETDIEAEVHRKLQRLAKTLGE